MKITHDDGPVVARVRNLVDPIASDLGLDVYDVEQRGDTLRVTLDTPPGSASGVDLDSLPWPPGWCRATSTTTIRCPATTRSRSRARASSASLRTPAHFQREIGQDPHRPSGRRRQRAAPARGCARRRRRHDGDARGRRPRHRCAGRPGHRLRPDRPCPTVFVWGPQAEAGRAEAGATTPGSRSKKPETSTPETRNPESSNKEKQSS